MAKTEFKFVGTSPARMGGVERVVGKGVYGIDLMLKDQLHGAILRSQYAHAKIVSIDTSEAGKIPGVHAVVTAADAIGAEITTIEGVADGDKLHPVQQAFIDTGAVQCGYCTPGFIISVKVLLDRTKKPTAEDIEEAVSGNICRCTGYNKIVDAIHLAASRL